MKIIFYGTPEFAVPSLAILLENGMEVVAVVTAPDKPAGRGLKPAMSAVKEFALSKSLHILQPEKLKDENFLQELKTLSPDLQIVVAFRRMPDEVWNFPPLGTFNLHGSLLPQYRGAAPIQRAMMNGETETGISTFFLQREIDTGKIIFREKIPIDENENCGSLYDRMMHHGAKLVLKTVQAIEQGKVVQVNQDELKSANEILHPAPKIHKSDCLINWNQNGHKIYNQIRGLSPYPGAFTRLRTPDGKSLILKIYRTEKIAASNLSTGKLETDCQTYLRIATTDMLLDLKEIQLEGKKRMQLADFLRGTRISTDWTVDMDFKLS